MRKAVYAGLPAAPVRLASGVIGVAGFVGSVWPEKVRSVIGEGELPVQGISIALLAVATIYFLVLWLLKPGDPNEGSANHQSSSGSHSPNYSSFRYVNNYYGPPAPAAMQERKSPHGSARGSTNLVVKRTPRSEFEEEWDYLEGKNRGAPARRDKPLSEALAYTLVGSWGRSFYYVLAQANETESAVEAAIRQIAYDGVIWVWGRRNAGGLYEETPKEYWRYHNLN